MAKVAKKKVRIKKRNEIEVSLPGTVRIKVEASSNGEAFQKYCEIAGILSSDHRPRFQRPEPDGNYDENGILRDKIGNLIMQGMHPGPNLELFEEDED